ncbi:unnamed protein product [Cylicocyclus nassatus]|uniref:AB hydrolase-1 domain-containing protein n=1 Tax=Cylicocyclus nassatus TaxID=53992 RepID=A0AA36H4T1_CYLNA|nr:unnamed protein product [Cylicocyclus nassatus]
MLSLTERRLCQLSVLFVREIAIRRAATGRIIYDASSMLFSVPVNFKNFKGDMIQLDAIYQDTMPDGGQRATVLALHGAPGSHADFKYLIPKLRKNAIRVISPNFPGQGFTKGHPRLACENVERNSFAQAVLDSVGITGSKDLYLLGHSRGGDNAVQIATSNKNLGNVRGVVMLNSAGLREHRAMRPFWRIGITIRLLDLKIFNSMLHPLLYFVYNHMLGLKVPTGEAAATALRLLRSFAYDKLLPNIKIINEHPEIKFLHAYSGDDSLIEANVSKEFAEQFKNRVELECSLDNSLDVSVSTIEAFSEGVQTVSVNFTNEGHFLQKFRAHFLVNVILGLVSMQSGKLKSDL